MADTHEVQLLLPAALEMVPAGQDVHDSAASVAPKALIDWARAGLVQTRCRGAGERESPDRLFEDGRK